ncbi:hypothetical protein ACLI4Z_09890 [Natrialbaceae archaeon A-arb3/5]
MGDRTPDSIVFRFVPLESIVRLNDRLSPLSRPAFWTLIAGFALYFVFNHDGRAAREYPPLAEQLGLEWLLPYPRLLPIGLMVGSLLFGVCKFGLTLLAVDAERRLERDGET